MTTTKGLTGKRIEIVVSDPWDFVTDNGSGPFAAVVERVEGDAILIRLDSVVTSGGQAFEFFVVTPRSESDDLADLGLAGRTVNCNLAAISDDAARSEHPCDLGSWRGGLGLLGSIEAVPVDKG